MTPPPPSGDAKEAYVYLLQSKKTNQYYLGWTMDLLRRLSEHNEGRSRATKNRGPFKLVHFETCGSSFEAKQLEKKLKRIKRSPRMFEVFKGRPSLCSPALKAPKEVAG